MDSMPGSLKGRTIAIPETRELDIFAGLLERRGASVLRCPFVAIHDAPDPKPVLGWVAQVNAGACDDLILLTGEGVRRLLACIDRHAPELRDDFVQQLKRMRKITRGPKPARALRELGLDADLPAEIPTTEGIIAKLRTLDLKERRIGVQLYGADPNERLIRFLEGAGARVLTVAPYVYADAAEDERVRSLGLDLENGKVDAIAFTSMQQTKRFFDLMGADSAISALSRTLVAAVGPLVAESLTTRGARVDVMPEGSFFLKPLTRALEERLGRK